MLSSQGVSLRELKKLKTNALLLSACLSQTACLLFSLFYLFTFKQACQFVKLGKLKHAA